MRRDPFVRTFIGAGLGIGVALVIVLSGGVNTVAGAAPVPNTSGTWYGSFSQTGGALYVVEGRCVLEVNDDGTFSARVVPGPGANNRAKSANWSGTVDQRPDRVVFRSEQGPWLTLMRADHTLYGVADDPITGAVIMIRLDRAGTT